MVTAAGILAGALLLVLFVFQMALAAGAPLGAMAWGGQNPGVLPRTLRIASAVVGLLLYPLIAIVILAAAGVIGLELPFDVTIAMWVLVVFFVLGTVVNAISRSAPERIWAVVSALLAACCTVIALG